MNTKLMAITIHRSRPSIRVLSEDTLDKNMNFSKYTFKGYNVLKQ